MSSEPRDYLRHILAEADYLLETRTGVTFQAFEADETLRRAFVRSLEIIGEAAKKVPAEFRAEHPRAPFGPGAFSGSACPQARVEPVPRREDGGE